MICPSCKAEYREGFTECPECQVSLVDQLPPEEQPEPDVELVTVFDTGDPADILVAKSLLDGAGIEFLAKDEGVQDIFGAGRLGSGFNTLAGPVEIQVRPEDADKARDLLTQLDEAKTESLDEEEDDEEEVKPDL